MSDDPLKDCPACHEPSLKKLVSAAAFRLKGAGWYETDFKTGSKKNVLHGVEGSDSGKSDSDGGGSSKSGSESSGSSSESSGGKSSSDSSSGGTQKSSVGSSTSSDN